MKEADFLKKNRWGLFIACVGIFMCLTLRFTIDYIRNCDVVDDKLFNLGLISAQKFTIQGRLTDKMYKIFKQNRQRGCESDLRLLSKQIIEKIEETMIQAVNDKAYV